MALIKCQKCGNEISDKARNCPHCGLDLTIADIPQPMATNEQEPQLQDNETAQIKQRKLWLAFLAGLGCMAIVAVLLWLIVFKDMINTNASRRNTGSEAMGACKDCPFNTYFTGFIGSTGYMTIDSYGKGSYTYDSNGTSLTRNIEVVSYDKGSRHLLIKSYNKSGEYIGVFDGYTTSDFSYSGTFTNYKGGMVEFRLYANSR